MYNGSSVLNTKIEEQKNWMSKEKTSRPEYTLQTMLVCVTVSSRMMMCKRLQKVGLIFVTLEKRPMPC